MKECGPCTEKEMVLAFLQAEIDSPRFGIIYQNLLKSSNLDRVAIIDNPDLTNQLHNDLRLALLSTVRGYKANTFLFCGFPGDVMWRRVKLFPNDYKSLIYANHETWVTLSGGSRLVIDGPHNIGVISTAENADTNINAVVAALLKGITYPELIAAQGPGSNDTLILIEGHTRATAYVLGNRHEPIDVIVGSSSSMHKWMFY
ncbi:hypothetical protein MUO65_02200 [bacterium]|nr:hypothetical protein [bacterium]